MQHHMMVDIGMAKMYLVRCCLCLYSEMHLNLMYSLVILKTHFFYLFTSIFFFQTNSCIFHFNSLFLTNCNKNEKWESSLISNILIIHYTIFRVLPFNESTTEFLYISDTNSNSIMVETNFLVQFLLRFLRFQSVIPASLNFPKS